MFIHGYIPDECLETVIVPIIKDNSGNVSDQSNYRPISLTTIFSKVIEIVLLLRYDNILTSVDNQFGFVIPILMYDFMYFGIIL